MKETLSFIELCEQTFRNNFDLPALSDYNSERTFSYGDIAKEIEKLHILFEEYDIKQGDKIALIGKNSSHWGIAYLAIITYGATVVPILPDFAPVDIHHIVNHSDSVLLFSSDSIFKNLEQSEMPVLKGVFSVTDNGFLHKVEGANFAKRLNEKFAEKYPTGYTKDTVSYPKLSDDNIVILNYTSGTTGFSKGVLITGKNLVGNLLFAREVMKLKRADKTLSLLPLAHTYGGTFEFLYPLMEGAHVTLLGKTPSPQILMKAFAEIKPHLIISVPLILEKIYKGMISPLINKKSIRFALKIPLVNTLIYKIIRNKLVKAFGGRFIQVVIGGAPLNRAVEDFLIKIKFPISVGYGMTECAPLVSYSMYFNYIKYSSGKILPCMEVRIASPDPYQIAGEIQVKGQNVMLGYYKNEEATREVFTEDGWLKTGDLGTIDKNNNVFIRGRSKNMFLGASGQNIYPEEIEAKLDNLPYVVESIVVLRKGKLVALIYPNYEAAKEAGISPEDLEKIMEENKETLNKMVAVYERVSEIQLYKEEFEKTPKRSIKRFLYDNLQE